MIVAPFLPLVMVSNSDILTLLEVFLLVNIAIYSSVGFGIGIHFNRSDSEIFGTDHWWYHNDYILDKGNNCITKQLELVLLGFNYKHFFWEGGFGSKFWGYGSRFGVMFSF